MSLVSFDIPENKKSRGFLMLSEGTERDQWHEINVLIEQESCWLLVLMSVRLERWRYSLFLNNL